MGPEEGLEERGLGVGLEERGPGVLVHVWGFQVFRSPTRFFVLVGHDLVRLRPCLWCRPSLGCLTR